MSSRQIRRLEKLVQESKIEDSDDTASPEVDVILDDVQPRKQLNLFDLLDEEEEEEEEEDENIAEEEEEEEEEENNEEEKQQKNNSKHIEIEEAIPFHHSNRGNVNQIQTNDGQEKSDKSIENYLAEHDSQTLNDKHGKKIVTLEEVEDGIDSEDDAVFEDAQENISIPVETTNLEKKAKNKKKKKKKKKKSNDNKKSQKVIDVPRYSSCTSDDIKKSLPLLQFNYRDLDPDNEYKNLFGDLSNKALEDTDEITSTFTSPEDLRMIKKLCRKIPSWKGKDHRSIPGSTRKLVLTKIRDDWLPTRQKNITMSEIKNDELILYEKLSNNIINPGESQLGVKFFKFMNAINEAELNSQFLISVVLTPDHESLIKLLQRNPYHVESILQVSNILVRQGDTANNSGLVERALFVFDRALSKSFEIGTGLHRLPFESFLNRQFCLTLFKYITILTQKGLFNTALTYCKFLLSVNPKEDPYGVRFFIDFYCLKSANEQYLIDLFESPIIQNYEYWITPGIVYSTSLAHFNLGNEEKAISILNKACMMYPKLALEILEIVCNYNDPFSFVKNKEYLQEIKDVHSTQSMAIANQTYLVRVKEIWKSSRTIEFLSKGIVDYFQSNVDTGFFMQDYQDNNEIQKFPKSLLRYAILSNENSILAKIPESFWNVYEVFEYDALPPENAATDYLQNLVDDNSLTNSLMRESEEQFNGF